MHLEACVIAAGVVTLLALTGGGSPATTDGSTAPSQPSASAPPAASPEPVTAGGIVGTVVRFSSDAGSVDVTVDQDNPAVRGLLSMLPVTLRFEDLSGREKIAYPPQRLQHNGSPGSDPENGDLIYFTPWGNPCRRPHLAPRPAVFAPPGPSSHRAYRVRRSGKGCEDRLRHRPGRPPVLRRHPRPAVTGRGRRGRHVRSPWSRQW